MPLTKAGNQVIDGTGVTVDNATDSVNTNIVKAVDDTTVLDAGADGSAVTLNAGGISGTAIKDDGTMADNSATHLVTQQSVKTYVNSTVTNYLNFRDEKSAGTDGGDFITGAWRTRELNTESTNGITGASLTSNQITLPTGTYRISARAPARTPTAAIRHKAILYNITDTSNEIIGSSCMGAGNTGDESQNDSIVIGQFTITSQKVFEIQHQISSTVGTSGFGYASDFGVVEVYTEVEIWKIL